MSVAEPLPLLDLRIDPEAIVEGYPFDVPAIRTLREIHVDSAVTLFVGENGTGKSTLLEAIALAADLPSAGTTELARDGSLEPVRPLAAALRLGWSARLRRGGLFVLDEAEAALSPLRQLAFLALLREAERAGAQVLMATHAPIVLAYPGATILSFDGGNVERVRFDDLEHVRLTRAVLADPEAFTHRL